MEKVYFEQLCSKDLPKYDHEFKLHINSTVEERFIETYNQEARLLENDMPIEEIKKCVNSLKRKLAHGYGGISAEHVNYGVDKLHSILTCLYNSISDCESIPEQLKRGIISPYYTQ